MSVSRHWIVTDESGRWHSGPRISRDEEAVGFYRGGGFTVEGPFVREGTAEALKARLRQEVDAHRMTLHEHALPFTDEEWQGYLGTIPGFEEGR